MADDDTDTGDDTGQDQQQQDDTQQQQQDRWTPPGSQDELDRIISDRLRRERAKFKDETATLRQKAAAHDALELELSSDIEKAEKRGRDEATQAAMARSVPRVVKAEFKAEAKGVLTNDQLDALLEGVDLAWYADDDGEPDTKKIAAKVAKFAPAKDTRGGFPDLGAGRRGGTAKNLSMDDVIRAKAGYAG